MNNTEEILRARRLKRL